MSYKRKTYLEKYNSRPEAEIKETEDGMMVIPPPKDYDELMRRVPYGKVITQQEIREALAKKYTVDFCCPLVTGIFVNIAAGKAEEDISARHLSPEMITPYWRTLRPKGELNPKYPGGVEAHAKMLKKEGHEIINDRKGVPRSVDMYRQKLANI